MKPTDVERHPHAVFHGDVVSDPANDEEDGHDWSAEGGATAEGPATHSTAKPADAEDAS